MDIVDRIFDLVDHRFAEQKDFAAALGVDVNLPSRWRNRKSKSYQKHLSKIAELLDTTVEYLLTGSKPEPAAAGDLSAEDAEILRQIHDRPGMRVMFSLTSKATDEDVRKATEIIRAFLGTPEGEP